MIEPTFSSDEIPRIFKIFRTYLEILDFPKNSKFRGFPDLPGNRNFYRLVSVTFQACVGHAPPPRGSRKELIFNRLSSGGGCGGLNSRTAPRRSLMMVKLPHSIPEARNRPQYHTFCFPYYAHSKHQMSSSEIAPQHP